MRKIDINVNKAVIRSFNITLDEETPTVSASVGLYSGEKRIASFSISTDRWHDVRFDLPATMVAPIMKIADELERILTDKCVEQLGRLEHKSE